jgi:hypothetical protein
VDGGAIAIQVLPARDEIEHRVPESLAVFRTG